MVARLVSSTASPHCYHPGELSSTASTSPPSTAHRLLHHQGQLHCFAKASTPPPLTPFLYAYRGNTPWGQGRQQGGQVTCFYALRAGSPVSFSPNNRVSCTVLQLVRDKDSFPPLMIPGLALSPTMGSKGSEGEVIFLSSMPPHGRQGGTGSTLLFSCPQGQLTSVPDNWISSSALPR